MTTSFHTKFYAYELTRRCPSDSLEKLAGAVAGAQVDLNPHQVVCSVVRFPLAVVQGRVARGRGWFMLEPKARNELEDSIVEAKKAAAVRWCENASAHAATCGGKPWSYALIPHDAIAENMTIKGLVRANLWHARH